MKNRILNKKSIKVIVAIILVTALVCMGVFAIAKSGDLAQNIGLMNDKASSVAELPQNDGGALHNGTVTTLTKKNGEVTVTQKEIPAHDHDVTSLSSGESRAATVCPGAGNNHSGWTSIGESQFSSATPRMSDTNFVLSQNLLNFVSNPAYNPIHVEGTVNLCLNGFVWQIASISTFSINNACFWLEAGAVLNIFDCNPTKENKYSININGVMDFDGTANTHKGGIITAWGGENLSTIFEYYDLASDTTELNLYGGTIGGTLNLYPINVMRGKFNMYGGEIWGSTNTMTPEQAEAVGMKPGAILVSDGGQFTMSGGKIHGNEMGGVGVYRDGDSSAAKFIMTGGEISGNTSYKGGGIYSGAQVEMSGGTISNNTATDSGGGIYNSAFGYFTMTGGTISGNTATNSGGGIYNENTTTISGGTIGDPAIVTDVTTAKGNKANKGGGIYNSDKLTISNDTASTLIYQNIATVNASGYSGLGGGIYNTKAGNGYGTFTMNSGHIAANRYESDDDVSTETVYGGGGVYNSSGGTFKMNGGNILNNTGKHRGAGVSNHGTFTMTAGSIEENILTMQGAAEGSGLYTDYIFDMSGGYIVYNIGASGVYYAPSTDSLDSVFSLSENPTISGNTEGSEDKNLYITSGSALTVDPGKTLGTNAEIYISFEVQPTKAAPVPFIIRYFQTGAPIINNVFKFDKKGTIYADVDKTVDTTGTAYFGHAHFDVSGNVKADEVYDIEYTDQTTLSTAGKYFLSKDTDLGTAHAGISVTNDVEFCFNGYRLTMNGAMSGFKMSGANAKLSLSTLLSENRTYLPSGYTGGISFGQASQDSTGAMIEVSGIGDKLGIGNTVLIDGGDYQFVDTQSSLIKVSGTASKLDATIKNATIKRTNNRIASTYTAPFINSRTLNTMNLFIKSSTLNIHTGDRAQLAVTNSFGENDGRLINIADGNLSLDDGTTITANNSKGESIITTAGGTFFALNTTVSIENILQTSTYAKPRIVVDEINFGSAIAGGSASIEDKVTTSKSHLLEVKMGTMAKGTLMSGSTAATVKIVGNGNNFDFEGGTIQSTQQAPAILIENNLGTLNISGGQISSGGEKLIVLNEGHSYANKAKTIVDVKVATAMLGTNTWRIYCEDTTNFFGVKLSATIATEDKKSKAASYKVGPTFTVTYDQNKPSTGTTTPTTAVMPTEMTYYRGEEFTLAANPTDKNTVKRNVGWTLEETPAITVEPLTADNVKYWQANSETYGANDGTNYKIYVHWKDKYQISFSNNYQQSLTYNGSERKFVPQYTIKEGAVDRTGTVAAPTDIDITYQPSSGGYSNNVPKNAGTYNVRLYRLVDDDFLGLDLYTSGLIKINPKTLTVAPVSLSGTSRLSKVYDGKQTYIGTPTKGTHYTLTGVVGTDTVDVNFGAKSFNSKDVAAANKVTAPFTATLKNNALGNYQITAGSIDLNAFITPMTLRVAPVNLTGTSRLTKVYDGKQTYTGTLTKGTHYSLGGVVSGDAVDITMTGTKLFNSKDVATASKVAAPFSTTLTGASAGNYRITADSIDLNAFITPKTISYVWTGDGGGTSDFSWVYNNTEYGPSATLATGITGESFNLSYTAKQKNVGDSHSRTVTPTAATGTKATNYSISSGTCMYKITPRPITIKVDNQSVVYGDTPTFTYTPASGNAYASGESIANITGLKSGYNATSMKNVTGSPYTMTPSGNTNANYNVTYTSGTLTITARPVTIRVNDKEVVYGDTLAKNNFTYADVGGSYAPGENYTFLTGLTNNYALADMKNVGSYELLPSGNTNANYNVAYTNTGRLRITKRPINIKVNDKEVTYGDTLTKNNFTYALVGTDTFGYDDDFDDLTGLTNDYDSVNMKNVPTTYYSISPSGNTNGNYQVQTVTAGKLTINKRPVSIRPVVTSKTYGNANPSFDWTYNGTSVGNAYLQFLPADIIDFHVGSTATQYSPVGNHTLTITPYTPAAKNYDVTYATGTMTIYKRTITVSSGQYKVSKDYDGKITHSGNLTKVNHYKLNNIVNNDDVDITVSENVVFDSKNVDTASKVTYAYTNVLKGASAGNYQITAGSSTQSAQITPAPISPVWTGEGGSTTDFSWVYNNRSYGPTPSFETGVVQGESFTFIYGDGGTIDAGSYTRTATARPANADTVLSNYAISGLSKDYIITTRQITVKVKDKEVTYGNTVGTLEYELTQDSGTYAADHSIANITGLKNNYRSTMTDANTYVLTPSGNTNANYTVTYSSTGKLTIKKRPTKVNVLSYPVRKTYDGNTNYTDTLILGTHYSLSDVLPVDADTLSLKVSGGRYDSKDVDFANNKVYITIELEGTSAKNYEPTTASGLVSHAFAFNGAIIPKSVSSVWGDTITWVYDGQSHKPTAAASSTGVIQGESLTLSVTGEQTNAVTNATATASITGCSSNTEITNYNLLNTTRTFSITPKDLIIVPTGNQEKVYGESDPALTYVHSGEVPSETPGFTGALSRDSGENVGTYNKVQGTLALANNGTFKATNYTLKMSITPVNFEITPATITDIVVTPYSGVYDAEVHDAITSKSATTINNQPLTWKYDASGQYTTDMPGYKDAGSRTFNYEVSAPNHYPESAQVTVAIGKADVKRGSVTIGEKTFGDLQATAGTDKVLSATDITANNMVGVPKEQYSLQGQFTLKILANDVAVTDGKLNANDAYTVQYTFTPTSSNYNKFDGTTTLKVKKATHNMSNAKWNYTTATKFVYEKDKQRTVVVTGLPTGVTPSYVNNAKTNAGDYTATVTLAYDATNYNKPTDIAALTWKIEKAVATIDVSGVQKVYTYNATQQVVNSGAVLNHNEAQLVYSDNKFTTVAEGRALTVKVTAAETGNYKPASNSFTLSVSKATLKDETAAINKTYDGNAYSLTLSATGFLGGDADKAMTLATKKYGTSADSLASDNISVTNVADSKTVFYSVEFGNYNTITGSKAITISKATLTDTTAAISKTYDGNASSLTLSATGFVGGDIDKAMALGTKKYGTSADSLASANISVTNVADSKTVYYSVEFDNYNTITGNKAITITPKEIAITWGADDFTYNGAEQKPTVSYKTISNTDVSLTATPAGNTFKNAGDKVFTASFATADTNYKLPAAVTKTYTMKKRPITVTIVPKTSIYGDTIATLTATNALTADSGTTGAGIVNNDTNVYSLATTALNTSDVGSYPITGTKGTNNNYTVTFANEANAYTITARPITVTIDSKTSVYGGEIEDLTAQVTSSSIVNNDTPYTLSTTASKTENVGNYKIAGTSVDTNYTITFENEADAYTITARELTLQWKGKDDSTSAFTWVYDGQSHKPTVVVGNTANNDAVTVAVSGEETNANKPVGSEYTATASIDPANANYKLPSNSTRTFTISKATLTDTTAAISKTYDGNASSLTLSATGFVAGEGMTLGTKKYGTSADSLASANISVTNVADSKTVFYSVEFDNYNTITGNKAITIGKKDLTVTPDSGQNKVYDSSADFVLTYKNSDTVKTEVPAFDGALSRDTVSKDVGVYAINQGDLALKDATDGKGFIAGNYTLVFSATPVTFEITKKAIAVPTANENLVYNAEDQFGVDAPVGTDPGYSIAGNIAKDARGYSATATVDSNHKWNDSIDGEVRTITYSIAKATVTAVDFTMATDKTYTDITATVGQVIQLGNDYVQSSEFKGMGTETFTFDVAKGSLTISVDQIAADYEYLNAGTYTVSYEFTPTDNYKKITGTETFVLDKAIQSELTLKVGEKNINKTGSEFNYVDSFKDGIALVGDGGNHFGVISYMTTAATEGVVTSGETNKFTISEAGLEFTTVVTKLGDNNYYDKVETFVYTINKGSRTISITNKEFKLNEDTTLNYEVKIGDAILSVEGETVTFSVQSGTATIKEGNVVMFPDTDPVRLKVAIGESDLWIATESIQEFEAGKVTPTVTILNDNTIILEYGVIGNDTSYIVSVRDGVYTANCATHSEEVSPGTLTLTIDPSGKLSTGSKLNVGKYTVNFEFAPDDAKLHNKATGETTLQITPKEIAVTQSAPDLSGVSKTYDTTTKVDADDIANLEFYTLDNFASDEVDIVPTIAYGSKDVTSSSLKMTYKTLSGADKDNYKLTAGEFTYQGGEILQKELTASTITATDRDYVKDKLTVELTGGELTGNLDGELAVEWAGAMADANVGNTKQVTITGVLSGTGSGNYSLPEVLGVTVNIAKANVGFVLEKGEESLVYGNKPVTVGDNAHILSTDFYKTTNTDKVEGTLTLNVKATADKISSAGQLEAGEYSFSYKFVPNDAGNYLTATGEDFKFIVTQKDLNTEVIIPLDKLLDGDNKISFTGGDIVANDVVVNDIVGGVYYEITSDVAAVGERPIEVFALLGGADAGNYNLLIRLSREAINITAVEDIPVEDLPNKDDINDNSIFDKIENVEDAKIGLEASKDKTGIDKETIDKINEAYEKLLQLGALENVPVNVKKIIDNAVATLDGKTTYIYGLATKTTAGQIQDMGDIMVRVSMEAIEKEVKEAFIEAQADLIGDLVFVSAYDVKMIAEQIMAEGLVGNSVEVQPKNGETVLVKMEVGSAFKESGLILHEHAAASGEKVVEEITDYFIITEGGKVFAVFTVEEFSNFYVFREKTTDSSGGSAIDDKYINFWREVRNEIEKGTESVITVNAYEEDFTDMPSSVLESLKGTDKSLHLNLEGGVTVTITGEQLKSITIKGSSYTYKVLMEMFPEKEPTPTPTPNPDTPETPSNVNNVTAWIIGAVAVAAIIIVGIAFAVAKKKRKNR